MIKRLLQLSLLFMLCLSAWAGNVTREEAMQKALQFVNKQPRMQKGKALRPVPRKAVSNVKGEQEGYYVFNVGEKQGFVLVSGDDRTPAILGYSEKGEFAEHQMPENLRWWLEEYERQLQALDKIESVKASSVLRSPVQPLMESQWYQNAPYWNQCPIDPVTYNRSYTGCEATAIAQIMYYHKYPQRTTETIPSYITSTRSVMMPEVPVTDIDWDNMLPVYTETASQQQQNAVATLMYLCGTALEMDYTSKASGAYGIDAPIALKTYFGYDEGMKYQFREEYTASEWDGLVYEELIQKRPVLYMGQSVGGGHAFVVDGYSEDNLFHVNWGWGGLCDGYFLLSILNPYSNEGIGASSSTDGYSFGQEIVTGIQPPTGRPVDSDRLITTYFYADQEKIDEVWPRDSLGGFTVPFYYYYRNNTMSNLAFEYGIGIFDQQDKLVEAHTLGDSIYAPLAYRGDVTVRPSIASQLAAGDYTIKGISRRTGVEQWKENTYSDMWQVLASVSDTAVTITTPYYNYSSSNLEVVGSQPVVGLPLTIRANVANSGMLQHETLYLMVNGKIAAGRQFEVGSNDTISIDFVFVPTMSGSNTVKLIQLVGRYYKTFASKTFYVNAAPTIELTDEISIEGLNNKGMIPSTTAHIIVTLTNNSTLDYKDEVRGVLYTYDVNGRLTGSTAYIQEYELGSGKTGTWELYVDTLKNGRKYSFAFAYRKNSTTWKSDWTTETYFAVEEVEEVNEDMTDRLVNPDFENAAGGWNVNWGGGGNVRAGGTADNICFEAWNDRGFDIYQEIVDLPKGVYEIKVQGFYRYLRGDDAWNAYQQASGKIDVPVYVYLNNSSTPFKNVFDEPVPNGQLYIGDFYRTSDFKWTFPNDMATGSQAFSVGMYEQSAYGMVIEDGDSIRIGVKGSTNQGGDSWVIWDNFKLIYHGCQANAIEPVLGKAIEDATNTLAKPMAKTAYEYLLGMIEIADEMYHSTDGEGMFSILSTLYDAQQIAQESAADFLQVTEELDKLLWDINHYDVATKETEERMLKYYETTLANANNHRYDYDDLEMLLSDISVRRRLVRTPYNMDEATASNPVECTSLMDSPSFEKDGTNSMDGWNWVGFVAFGNDAAQVRSLSIEYYQKEVQQWQTIVDIPNGYYRVTARGFYRYGSAQNDYQAYTQNNRPKNAVLFMYNGEKQNDTPLKMISDDASDKRLGIGDEMQIASDKWVPNDMVSSVGYFKNDRYLNECIIEVNAGILTVGVLKNNVYDFDWVILDDFRLYYLGTSAPGPTAINEVKTGTVRRDVFNLNGQKAASTRGSLQIVREVQEDGQVIVRKQIRK